MLAAALTLLAGIALDGHAPSADGPYAEVDVDPALLRSFDPAGPEKAFVPVEVRAYRDVLAVRLPPAGGAREPCSFVVAFYEPGTLKRVGVWRGEGMRTESGRGFVPGDAFDGRRGDDGLFVFHPSSGREETRYVDKRGKLVRTVPKLCLPFFEGRAVCTFRVPRAGPDDVVERAGWIDEKGAPVGEPRFVEAFRFRDGVARAVFAIDEGAASSAPETAGDVALRHTFVDVSGKTKWRDAYREATDFVHGRAFVVADAVDAAAGGARALPAQRGYIDASGTVVIPLLDESGDAFSAGVAVVRGPKGERVIDVDGKTLLTVPLPFRVFGAFVPAHGAPAAEERGEGVAPEAAPRARVFGDRVTGEATLHLDGTFSDVPALWTEPAAWPASLGPAPTAIARPRDLAYGAFARTASTTRDPEKCTDAALAMVSVSRGADPDAWAAAEACAALAKDEARAALARQARFYVTTLDPAVQRTREAWRKLGGRLAP